MSLLFDFVVLCSSWTQIGCLQKMTMELCFFAHCHCIVFFCSLYSVTSLFVCYYCVRTDHLWISTSWAKSLMLNQLRLWRLNNRNKNQLTSNQTSDRWVLNTCQQSFVCHSVCRWINRKLCFILSGLKESQQHLLVNHWSKTLADPRSFEWLWCRCLCGTSYRV